MVRLASMLTIAGLLASALAAQDRRPAFVLAIDAQGRPVVGATITCFASPAFFETTEDVDVVEGVADERGRVVAKLLTHRVYSAFAILPGEDGRFRASETHEDVAAGAEVVLRVVVERRSQRLVIEGEAAWQHVGPLGIAIAPEACNRLLVPVQDGQVPRLPSLGCVLVRDAQGQPLWSQPFQSFEPWRKPGELQAQLLDRVVVKLPPPQELGVRVVDPDGRPIANAVLSQAIEQSEGSRTLGSFFRWLPRPAWRQLGCTGADGMVKVQVAVAVGGSKVQGNLVFRAHAAGRAYGVGGVMAFGNAFDGPRQLPTPRDGVLSITLAPSQRLRVHPPGSYEVTLLGQAAGRAVPRAREEGPVHVTTDAAGNAELPLAHVTDAVRVARLLRAGELPIWSVVATDGVDSWVGSAPQEIRVQATDAGGHPARGRQVVLVPWLANGPGFDLPMPLDHAGRTTLRVNGGVWFLWCGDGDEAAWAVADCTEQSADMALQLRPIPRATVRIVDADGKPRVGFRMSFGPSLDWDSQNPSVENRCLIYRQVGLLAATMRQSTTDAEGCLHYPVLPLPKARLGFGGGPAPDGGAATPKTVIEVGERTDLVVK